MSDATTEYKKLVRLTGFVDLGLFTVLALPFISTQLLALLFAAGQALGDSRAIPNLKDPFVMLAINLVGILGMFTAWLRIKTAAENHGPSVGVLKLFAAGLFGFSVIMGAPLVLLTLLLADLITGTQLLVKRNVAF